MQYKDITYVLKDKAIVPYKMGTVAIHLYDNNKSCKKYAFSSPEVNAAVEFCKNHSLEDEVENMKRQGKRSDLTSAQLAQKSAKRHHDKSLLSRKGRARI